jgi:hypothetical protein
MQEILNRVAENMMDRISGPMHLRILLQPAMAMVFAVIAGLKDAREGKSPYFWSLFSNAEHRREMLRDGWKSVGKVFVIAMLLDVVYQIVVQRFVYPGEVVLVSLLLAIVPYLVVRGLVTRLARLFR